MPLLKNAKRSAAFQVGARLRIVNERAQSLVLFHRRSAQMRVCLAQLSRDHREILDLVYYQEKSVEEVAEVIQIPKSTVKTRMFYARKRLAQLLSAHRDFDHLAACRAA